MSWLDGPLDPQDYFLHMKMFWWTRITGTIQLLSGASFVAEMLSEQQKDKFHKWLEALQGLEAEPAKPTKYYWFRGFAALILGSLAIATIFSLSAMAMLMAKGLAPATATQLMHGFVQLFPAAFLIFMLILAVVVIWFLIFRRIMQFLYVKGRVKLIPRCSVSTLIDSRQS